MKTYQLNCKRDTRNLDHHPIVKLSNSPLTYHPIDLRNQFPAPPYDQGEEGSCTANAGVGLAEFDEQRQGLPYLHLSRQFLYYNTRNMEGTVSDDSGATIADTVTSWARFGICEESYDPYIPANLTTMPSTAAYDNAKPEVAQNYSRVNQDVASIYGCLAAGFPIIFGIQVYDSFFTGWDNHGVITIPEPSENCQGGHAILIVGIDVAKDIVIFRNSWGTDSGDGGYGTLPLTGYVLNPNLAYDLWTVRGIGLTPGLTPAPSGTTKRAKRGLVRSGFLESVGDDSPIWKLADALEANGDTVMRLDWTQDGTAILNSGLDYIIDYSWGKAAFWNDMSKMPVKPTVPHEFAIAGVPCFLFGQFDGWTIPSNITTSISFNVNSFPVSDPIKNEHATSITLSDFTAATSSLSGTSSLCGLVNVDCNGLGLSHTTIDGDSRIHQGIYNYIAGIE